MRASQRSRKAFQSDFAVESGDFAIERGEQIRDGVVQRVRRVVSEFRDGVHDLFAKIVIPTDGFSRSGGTCFCIARKSVPPLKGLKLKYCDVPSAEALGYLLPSRFARLVSCGSILRRLTRHRRIESNFRICLD